MLPIKRVLQLLLIENKMSNKMKEVDKIKQKLENAINTLQEIANEYKFDFMLNFISGVNGLSSGSVNNPHLTPDALDRFIHNIKSLQQEMIFIPSLLKAGYTVVICNDDGNKPELFRGDWIKKGHIYVVKEIQVLANKQGACYILYDMKVELPFTGFNVKRFTRVIEGSALFN